MKPVKQTRFGEEGNCWQACIASILELELDEVPDFVNDYDDWYTETFEWLSDKDIGINYDEVPILEKGEFLAYIGCGVGKRELYHAVVLDFNLNMIHDPSPKNKGLDKIEAFFCLSRREFGC